MLHLQISHNGNAADASYCRLADSGGGYCSDAEMSILHRRLSSGNYGIRYISFGNRRVAVGYTLSSLCKLAIPVNESVSTAEAASPIALVHFNTIYSLTERQDDGK